MFIPFFDRDQLQAYLQLASVIRSAGIQVDLYPEAKKLGQQLKYASERGFLIALIQGREELEKKTCQVKDLRERVTNEVSVAEGHDQLVSTIRQIIDRNNKDQTSEEKTAAT